MSAPSAAAKRAPSAFVVQLLARAARPHKIVDFLRDAEGNAAVQIHIRGLSQEEQDLCFANALEYVIRLQASGVDATGWDTNDLEHNSRASEILAVACRKLDDPSKPFFEHGVVDTRQFGTEELGQLINAYNELKQEFYPELNKLDEKTFEMWIDLIAEGAAKLPFHALSRETLEALARSALLSLVDARATIRTMSTDSSTSE